MAASPIDLPVMLAQIPIVSKIATAEVTAPEAQRDIFGPLINAQIQKDKREKVQHVDVADTTLTVDRDGGHENQPEQQQAKSKRDDRKEEEETQSSTSSPWSGNIINVKI